MNISHEYLIDSVLFVSDLQIETNEEDLFRFFENYHLTLVKIFKVTKRESSCSYACAYAFFENYDYAKRARKDLNGEILVSMCSSKKFGKPVRICKYELESEIKKNKNDTSKSLFVRNINKEISAKELFKMFEEFGEVRSSKLEVNNKGESKGYGFVHFKYKKSSELAKEKLNGKMVIGQKLLVVNLIRKGDLTSPPTIEEGLGITKSNYNFHQWSKNFQRGSNPFNSPFFQPLPLIALVPCILMNCVIPPQFIRYNNYQ